MATTLERVISVKQTSKAATCLPLELMQHVFRYLDGKTFYAARKACRYWQFASTGAVPLARQLSRMPILPPVEAAKSSPIELRDLYDEAARSLMMSVKSERQWDEPGSLTRPSKMGFTINPRIAATRNSSRTVTLYDRTIALFDTSGEKSVCLAQRPLNDLKETVGSGPWLKTQPNAYYEMALSSTGTLLAIAQERTIQIYDLTAESDSFTVNQYISSATGHYICGLDFEQDDHVLRIRLSGKGAVIYLGCPPDHPSTHRSSAAIMEHWKSRRGLKHTFLDSSLLTALCSTNETSQIVGLSGLQLLKPFAGGYLLAGQRHGGGMNSHYFLGHVQTATPDNMAGPKVTPDSLVILARLESFLSAYEYTLGSSNENGQGLWENMPSAHEHHPRFALTTKGAFIALAERDKKRIRPAPLTQLFVYRIPCEADLQLILKREHSEATSRRGNNWATKDSFLDKLELLQSQASKDEHEDARPAKAPSKYTVPRLPLCLSTIQGDIEHLSFKQVGDKAYAISAGTVETTRTWRLDEW